MIFRWQAWVVLFAVGCSGGGTNDDDDDGGTSPGAPVVRRVIPPGVPFRAGGTVRVEGRGLAGVEAARFGDVEGQLVEVGDDALTVRVPPSPRAGPVTLHLEGDDGDAQWTGFRFLGVPPQSLRFVQLPAVLDVPAERVWAAAGEPPQLIVSAASAVTFYGHGEDAFRATATYPRDVDGVRAACVADFDGDGAADDLWLVDSGEIAHLYTAGSPPRPPYPVTAGAVACGDFTGDGVADVLVAVTPLEGVATLQLFISGATAAPTTLPGTALALAAGDLDGDGDLDVLAGRDGAPPRLLLNDGAGAFADAAPGVLPPGGDGARPVVGDLDGDDDLDVFLLGPDGAALWLADGGRFADHSTLAAGAPGQPVRELQLADADADTSPDVLVLGPDAARLYRNDGSGRLFDYSDALIGRPGGPPTALAAADFDGDGDLDLVAVRDGAAVYLRGWDPAPFADPDADLVPSEVDACPDHADPLQGNRDARPFRCATPEACLAETGCTLAATPGGRAFLTCPGPTTHGGALGACAARGARLFFPSDPPAQAFVATLAPGRYWLDLTDVVTEAMFASAAGQAPPFTSWGMGQPDDAGMNEDCVELNTTDPLAPYWNDLPCDAMVGYVCEDAAEEAPDPADACDVCPDVHDPAQLDGDGDGVGDACDACPAVADPAGCPPP